ncbi:MAG: hypothetical protein ACREUW_09755 [Burkholderiales bacterium]
MKPASLPHLPGALLICAAAFLAGCIGPYTDVRKEEAVLSTTRVVEVVRWSKLDQRYQDQRDDWTGLPTVVAYGVAIPLPRGGRVDWEGDGTLLPMAVTTDALSAYLVATPRDCAGYEAAGAPVPPYAFFRSDGGRWQRITVAEFPATVTEANLLVPLNAEAIAVIRRGPVQAETIRRLNAKLDPDARIINRTGPWPVWEKCMRDVETRKAQEAAAKK